MVAERSPDPLSRAKSSSASQIEGTQTTSRRRGISGGENGVIGHGLKENTAPVTHDCVINTERRGVAAVSDRSSCKRLSYDQCQIAYASNTKVARIVHAHALQL
ncbi:hypothetical protein Mapa_002540 [Marchantia paleacea]|nr:hypothetical protein Mapa_002540 [Marchantia paleacea]